MKIHADTDVLLVIDVQNDFCPGGSLAVGGGDEVVPVINRLARKFDHVVLTQDWHPAGHSSFASSHPGKDAFIQIDMPYARKRCGQTTASSAARARSSGATSIFRIRSF